MELLQLKYFQAVAEMEHITKAAQMLNVTQPSLSKTIARLEEDVGVPLFDRQGRNIRLNSFGKVFLEHVTRAFRELEDGEKKIHDMAGMSEGSVKIATSITSILPDLLGSFLRKYPNIHFRQVLQPPTVVKKMLEEGEIDLSITGPIEGSDLEWRLLRTEEIYVVVPENHRLAGQSEVRMSDLKDEPFLGLGSEYWFRSLMEGYCHEAGFTPKYIMEVDEPDAIVLLIKQGLGICFVPELAWKKRAQFLPHRLKIKDMECQYRMGITWSRKHYLSKAAQQFFSFVIDYFEHLQQNNERSL